jgi:hypothetical protein
VISAAFSEAIWIPPQNPALPHVLTIFQYFMESAGGRAGLEVQIATGISRITEYIPGNNLLQAET